MTAPLGSMSLAQEYLRITLADCAAFRTLVGATGGTAQAQALARIHHDALPPPRIGSEHSLAELELYRPCALLWQSQNSGFGRKVVANQTSIDHGVLMIRIAADVDKEISENHQEVYIRFQNAISQILDELVFLAGQAGYLAITAIDVESGPYRTHPDEYETTGDCQFCDLRITWGAEG